MDEKIIPNEKSTFWDNSHGIQAVVFIAIGITAGLAAIVSIYIDEISNNVTLIVEVGVGIIIALVVLYLTKKSEKQNQNTLNRIQQIEHEQSNLIKEMKPIIEKQGMIIREQENILNRKRQLILPFTIHEYVIQMYDVIEIITRPGQFPDLSVDSLQLYSKQQLWRKFVDDNRDIMTGDEIVIFEGLISDIGRLIDKIKSKRNTNREIKSIIHISKGLLRKIHKSEL